MPAIKTEGRIYLVGSLGRGKACATVKGCVDGRFAVHKTKTSALGGWMMEPLETLAHQAHKTASAVWKVPPR